MIKNKVLEGVFLIGIGASSYGMLATFVKLAYGEGYTTPEVTIAQFLYGILGMSILAIIEKRKSKIQAAPLTRRKMVQLIAAGTSLGMTSVFYYLSVKFIPVSIAIILLMQTVWMGVILELILEKKAPSNKKIAAVLVVLIGTFLATDVVGKPMNWDWRGIVLGLLSAVSFSTTMFTAHRVGVGVSASQRSLFMLFGGFIIVIGFALVTFQAPFHWGIFLKWGIVLALFGTIIPPLLFNAGFPYTGMGLGSIVAALELPVSVLMAYFILGEKVNFLQWFGIALIILAIVVMNIETKKK